MRIEKIIYPQQICCPLPKKQNFENQNQQNYSYNPIAYKDYNINFSARLFRSPENFYAQPFNKNGMPETMINYLNADFEDRQKMPPAQMLKLVFGEIKDTDSLQQVKRLYSGQPGCNPKEHLFENLTDTPNKKARTGILAEIDLMKEEGKPLFKNGKDNLGYYILKKIYTEAKTLKEINEDFNKDVSVYYNGLSPIGYDTLRAYGIKFPNNAFWKSLTATREEFPYEYKPRKPIENRTSTINKSASNSKLEERNRFSVKDWEVGKLADALVKGKGSYNETLKQIKRQGIKDNEVQNFVAKYMSEINSIVLDNLHISPDMKDFFATYDGNAVNQRKKFEEYMKNPYINELRSRAMKDTIKLFFTMYGADGQNDDFKELLEYARSIKPNRLAQSVEHDKKQAYYENIFANLSEAPESLGKVKEAETPEYNENLEIILDEVSKNNNCGVYKFDTDKGEVVILSNLKEAIAENIKTSTKFFPDGSQRNYINYVINHPLLTEDYMLRNICTVSGIHPIDESKLMDVDKALKVAETINRDFIDENMLEASALQQAVADGFAEAMSDHIIPGNMLLSNPFSYVVVFNDISEESKNAILSHKDKIDKNYKLYRRPLTDSEVQKIYISVMDWIRNYDKSDSYLKHDKSLYEMDAVIMSFSKLIKNKENPVYVSKFKQNLINYIKEFGGSSRVILSKDSTEQMKQLKAEQIVTLFVHNQPTKSMPYAALDEEGLMYVRHRAPKLYKVLEDARRSLM